MMLRCAILLGAVGDPEIATRIAQYEMAYKMQASVPELTDFSDEPQHVLDMYGPEVTDPGTFAYNCLLARRLAERGVRFIQLYHRDWDHHGAVKDHVAGTAKEVDQPCAALIKDLNGDGAADLLTGGTGAEIALDTPSATVQLSVAESAPPAITPTK